MNTKLNMEKMLFYSSCHLPTKNNGYIYANIVCPFNMRCQQIERKQRGRTQSSAKACYFITFFTYYNTKCGI